MQGLNLRPHPCKGCALPTELIALNDIWLLYNITQKKTTQWQCESRNGKQKILSNLSNLRIMKP